MARWRWVAAALFLAMLVGLGVVCGTPLADLVLSEGHVLVETVLGETPERHIDRYLSAIRRGDRERALAEWALYERATDDLRLRRETVTDELLALGGGLHYSIEGIEWWRNCCEPGRVSDPAAAGVARVTVAVSGEAIPAERYYTFDVGTTTTYWGAAGGNPIRRWALLDAYPAEQRPLGFPWPGVAPTPGPEQTLAGTERDRTVWQGFSASLWSVSFLFPPGWQVVEEDYTGSDGGLVVRVRAAGRELDLVRHGELPTDMPPEAGLGHIGPLPARRYLQTEGGNPQWLLLVPETPTDEIALVTIGLLGTTEDEEYLRLFEAILETLEFR